MVSEHSVLIVDSSEENREVLRTALEHRGLKVFAADRARRGLELTRRHRPDLIVLDLEADDTSADELCRPFARPLDHRPTTLLLLGTYRPRSAHGCDWEFVSKPYHYAPLIRRIEELVNRAGRSLARAA